MEKEELDQVSRRGPLACEILSKLQVIILSKNRIKNEGDKI